MFVAIDGQRQTFCDQFERAFRDAFQREMSVVGEIVADYGQRVRALEKEVAQLRDLLRLNTDASVAETCAALKADEVRRKVSKKYLAPLHQSQRTRPAS